MLCQLCGETNPDGAEKCSRCGDKLAAAPQKQAPKDSSIINWLIAIVCLMIIAAVIVPNFSESSIRSKPSRAKNDMRSLATALEAYYVDYNCYPVSSSNITSNLYARFGPKSPMASQPTFGLLSYGFYSITTPVAFMSELPYDPFAPVRHAPFCYYTDPAGKGWILWSAGPDMKYDLTSRNIGGIYNPANPDMASDPALLSLTFDPTNGATSRGDIWRISGNQPVPAFSPTPAFPPPPVSWIYDPTNGVTRSGFGGEYRIKQ